MNYKPYGNFVWRFPWKGFPFRINMFWKIYQKQEAALVQAYETVQKCIKLLRLI